MLHNNSVFPTYVIVNRSGVSQVGFSCILKKQEVMKACFVGSFIFFSEREFIKIIFWAWTCYHRNSSLFGEHLSICIDESWDV